MHTHPNMQALRTAIPYIRAYAGGVFVVKLGGRLCHPGPELDNVVEQLALLATLGVRLLVVHGGGDQISDLARRIGIEPRFVAGRRITDEPTLELAKMMLAGTINIDLVAAFRRHGVAAAGLTGVDGGTITVVRRPVRPVNDPATGETREVDFGWVGDIAATRMDLLCSLLDQRVVPVIGTLAADAQGRIYNVNADTVAARLAVDLRAVKYILLTTVDGIMLNVEDSETLQPFLDLDDLEELKRRGVVGGGMLPKIAACAEAVRGGVPRVHVINGTSRDAVLAEIFTNEGSGTLIVAQREKATAKAAT